MNSPPDESIFHTIHSFKPTLQYSEVVSYSTLQKVVLYFDSIFKENDFEKHNERLTNQFKWKGKSSLLSYLQKCKRLNSELGLVHVTYKQKPSKPFHGRYYANGIAIQNIPRVIRHTLINGLCEDVDIPNCHPMIMKQLCINLQYSKPTPHFDEYLQHRDSVFSKVIDETKLDKEQIKSAIISFLNNGKKYYKTCNYLTQLHLEFSDMILFIKDKFSTEYDLYDYTPNKGYNNKLGSFIAHLLQECENDVLQLFIKECEAHEVKIFSLCYDGATCDSSIHRFLSSINENVRLELEKHPLLHGYNPNFIIKPMKQGLDLDSLDLPNTTHVFERSPFSTLEFDRIHDEDYLQLKANNPLLMDLRRTGAGKTTNAIQYCIQQNKSFMYLSHRQSLDRDIITKYEIQSYKDKKIDPEKSSSVVINSLALFLKRLGKCYSDIPVWIIDEMGSMFSQFEMKGMKDNIIVLFDILRHHSNLIVLDANLSVPEITFIKQLRMEGPYTENFDCITQKTIDYPYKAKVVTLREVKEDEDDILPSKLDFIKQTFKEYTDKGQRKFLMALSMDIRKANDLLRSISQVFNLNYLFINRETRIDMDLSTKHLSSTNILAYSPTISEGVSYDDDVFAEYVGIHLFTPYSCGPETCSQMVKRFRKVTEHTICIYKRTPHVEYYSKEQYIKYYQTALETGKHIVPYHNIGKPYFDRYFDIHVNNVMKQQRGKMAFVHLFFQLLANNGFLVTSEEIGGIIIHPSVKEAFKAYYENCPPSTLQEVIQQIKDSRLLTHDEYLAIKSQDCSREKFCLEKKYEIHKTCLSSVCDNIDPSLEFYQTWYHYKNRQIVDNLKKIIYWRNNEGLFVTVRPELQFKNYEENSFSQRNLVKCKDNKLHFIRYTTRLLGFDDIISGMNIPVDTFITQFKNIPESHWKTASILFGKIYIQYNSWLNDECQVHDSWFSKELLKPYFGIQLENDGLFIRQRLVKPEICGYYNYSTQTVYPEELPVEDPLFPPASLFDNLVETEHLPQVLKDFTTFFKGSRWCPLCKKEGKHPYYTLKHQKLKGHQKAMKGIPLKHQPGFPCTFEECTRTFTQRKDLDTHLKSHTKDPNRFTCPYCRKKERDNYNLNQHIKRCHI
jgi:hypothetical protein